MKSFEYKHAVNSTTSGKRPESSQDDQSMVLACNCAAIHVLLFGFHAVFQSINASKELLPEADI